MVSNGNSGLRSLTARGLMLAALLIATMGASAWADDAKPVNVPGLGDVSVCDWTKTVSLPYSDTGDYEAGCDCITCCLSKLSKNIEEAGGAAGKVDVRLKARVERSAKDEVILRIDVTPPVFNPSGKMKPEKREAIKRDISVLVSKLRAWSHTLTAKETKDLAQGKVTVSVSDEAGTSSPIAVSLCATVADEWHTAEGAAKDERP